MKVGTGNHAVKGNGPLANKILANRVMIPDQEAYKSNIWHVKSEDECFLPHRIKSWKRMIENGNIKFMQK